jgi:ribonuclease BN (tRNA processing enzyme)
MASYALQFLGVGNALAPELGESSAVLLRDREPLLLIDCGAEVPTRFRAAHERPVPALFVTHSHFDHVGGFERLFISHWFDERMRGRTPVFVAAPLLPLLHQRVASHPNALAEGGANFWQAFQLVPVDRGFWLDGLWFDVFPVRHHAVNAAWGLALRGSFVYTGDTRPIPGTLTSYADAGEIVFHDCCLHGNPSHTGIGDLEREYPPELRQRMVLYHYGSQNEGDILRGRGYRVAQAGECFELPTPMKQAPDAVLQRTRLA